ncbi:MAG: NUDIX hydrolase [Anaerolineae bacterium]|nr:NUDIX hydrolase [Anaerolineae bacterium]
MKQGQVRPIAICIFRREDQILVAEWYDRSKGHHFYRPLGGTIEFGERSQQTIERELMEELGAQVTDLRYLTTVENLFVYNGQQGHEIVLLYEGSFVDHALYEVEVINGQDDGDVPLKAVWKRLDSFGPSAPLYPDGLLELLAAQA